MVTPNRMYPLFFPAFLVFLALTTLHCQQAPHEQQRYAQEKDRAPTQLSLTYPADGRFTNDNFYDFPFPHALRIEKDGTPDLSSFPVPKRQQTCPIPPSQDPLVGSLIGAYEPDDFLRNMIRQANLGAVGAGNNPTFYLRFNRPLASRTLPLVGETIHPNSPVFLVNLETNSPAYGQRLPVRSIAHIASRFLPNYVAAFRPEDGFVLRPNERYALVLLRSLRDEEGWPLNTMPSLEQLTSPQAPSQETAKALWDSYQPLWMYLKDKTNHKPEDIAAASVIVAGDPIKEQKKLVDFLRDELPPPATPTDIVCRDPGATLPYIRCTGNYRSPNFQFGDPPYLDEKTGFFTYDANQKPIYRMERLRFALTWPKQALAQGAITERPLPIVLYAHGTGGDYTSFIGDGTARRLAEMGIPALGIDQVMHAQRGRILGNVDLNFLFFNALNLPAARDNVRQSALDYHWLVRLMKDFAIEYEGQRLRVDPKRVWFMGHSQGGLIGPLFLALEHETPAAFLSAPGALLVNMLLSKTEPKDPIEIPAVIRYLVCDGAAVLTPFHPIFSALQGLLDPADPVNYGSLILDPQRPPMQFFMTKGMTDNYAPPAVFDPLVVAMQLPLFGDPQDNLPGLRLQGVPVYPFPVSGNLSHPSGIPITAGFSQHKECRYSSGGECDGHFVTFYNPDAIRHWTSFFRSLVNRPTAEVY